MEDEQKFATTIQNLSNILKIQLVPPLKSFQHPQKSISFLHLQPAAD